MPNQVTDAPAASSPATDSAEPLEPRQDAPDTSSTSGDQDAPPPSKEEEAVSDIDFRIAQATGENTKETPESTTDETEPAKTDEPASLDKSEAKTDALSQEQKQVTDEVPQNFTERPEWQALTKIGDKLGKEAGAEVRKTLRGLMDREMTLANHVEQAKPAVELYNELYTLAGNNTQGVQGTMTLIRTFEHDPKAAVPVLERLINDARQRAGLVVTSPDLAAKIEQIDKDLNDGVITAEAAKERKNELTELEQLRFGQKRTAAQIEAQKQQQVRVKTDKELAELTAAIDATEVEFTSDKKANDPDFPAVKNLFDKFSQLAAGNFQRINGRWPTTAEAKQILEQTYKEAKAEAIRLQPKRKSLVPVRDEGLSRNTRHQAVTPLERFEERIEKAIRERS